MSKTSRYTVTFEVYVEGHNDKAALAKANLIARNQNILYPNQQWDVTQLHSTPWATLYPREVDINQIKTHTNNY